MLCMASAPNVFSSCATTASAEVRLSHPLRVFHEFALAVSTAQRPALRHADSAVLVTLAVHSLWAALSAALSLPSLEPPVSCRTVLPHLWPRTPPCFLWPCAFLLRLQGLFFIFPHSSASYCVRVLAMRWMGVAAGCAPALAPESFEGAWLL